MPGPYAILFTAACALLGAALLFRGLRGKRTDDHPLCRKCRFDLHGLAAPTTCPECGADLAGRRAIRTGHRRKRRGSLAAGALLLLIPAGIGGAYAWSASTGFNWNTIKPDFWLAIEAKSNNAETSKAALIELVPRAQRGALNRARRARLVDHALAVQADASQTWLPGWGNLVEVAWEKGDIPEASATQYMRNSAQSSAQIIHTSVSQLMSEIEMSNLRRGDGTVMNLVIVTRLEEVTNEGADRLWPLPNSSQTHEIGAIAGMANMRIMQRVQDPALAPGVHEYQLRLGTTIVDIPRGATWHIWAAENPSWRSTHRDAVLAEWVSTHSSTVQTPDPDEPLATLVPDVSIKGRMAAAIGIDRCDILHGDLSVVFDFGATPAHVAFDVYVLDSEGNERRIGAVSSDPDDPFSAHAVDDAPDPTAETITIILRASQQAARDTMTTGEIWDGEIVIENVPVVNNNAPDSP